MTKHHMFECRSVRLKDVAYAVNMGCFPLVRIKLTPTLFPYICQHCEITAYPDSSHTVVHNILCKCTNMAWMPH